VREVSSFIKFIFSDCTNNHNCKYLFGDRLLTGI